MRLQIRAPQARSFQQMVGQVFFKRYISSINLQFKLENISSLHLFEILD